jgi:thymidylate synthase
VINTFSGETADLVWQDAFAALTRDEDTLCQQSRLGLTRELLHVHFHIRNPRQRWVLSRHPAINPAFAIAEVFWILSGSNEFNFIRYWNPALTKFIGNNRRCHGAYGHRIRRHFEIDQFQRAFDVLEKNPHSRQVVIQIWDTKVDLPADDGSPQDADIPCNICSMPKVRDGKLEWLQIMRSNDLYRGTPYNIVQFTMLQEILAGWLGVGVGGYNQISDSLHIYDYDYEGLGAVKCSTYSNDDNLAISKCEFDRVLPIVLSKMEVLTQPCLSKQSFIATCTELDLPCSYKNLFVIAAADSARRRGWKDEVHFAISLCSNPALLASWTRWAQRWEMLAEIGETIGTTLTASIT